MMGKLGPFFALLALTAVVACGSNDSAPAPAASPGGDAPQQQRARGAQVYASFCAACHGNSGEGTISGPPVVGAGALPTQPRAGSIRNVQFRTVLDVFEWTAENMPADSPGSLPDEDIMAVLAFALHANGVAYESVLDEAEARTIELR
jgi:cytochrome c